MFVKAISSKGQGATGSAGGRVGAHEVELAVNPSRKHSHSLAACPCLACPVAGLRRDTQTHTVKA